MEGTTITYADNTVQILSEKIEELKTIMQHDMIYRKKWLTRDEAALMLDMNPIALTNSRTDLGIVYSQRKSGGIILYERESIEKHLEKNSNRKYLTL